MTEEIRIVAVNAANVEKEGFFCFKSKPKAEGYRRKLAWLKARFAEGMRMKILYEGKRSFAFIEYIPGAFTWRAVNAPNYMVIHCLWVVGQGKGRGFGEQLLNDCLADAQSAGMDGVAMVSSEGVWLASKKFFLKNGFQSVDQAEPAFNLLVKKFNPAAPNPTFPTNWAERSARYGDGLTILRSDQCPYIVDAVALLLAEATERGIPARVIEIENARQAQELSPSPYGLFGVVYNGQLLSYHYLTAKELAEKFPPTEVK